MKSRLSSGESVETVLMSCEATSFYLRCSIQILERMKASVLALTLGNMKKHEAHECAGGLYPGWRQTRDCLVQHERNASDAAHGGNGYLGDERLEGVIRLMPARSGRLRDASLTRHSVLCCCRAAADSNSCKECVRE